MLVEGGPANISSDPSIFPFPAWNTPKKTQNPEKDTFKKEWVKVLCKNPKMCFCLGEQFVWKWPLSRVQTSDCKHFFCSMLDILGRNKSLLRQCDIAGFLAIYSYFLSDISILPSENIRPPPLPSKKDNVEYFQMPASAWRLSRVGRRPKPKPNLGQNSRLLGSSAYPTVRGGGGDVSPQLERGKVNCEGKEEGAAAWMHEGEFAENDDSQAVLTTVAWGLWPSSKQRL